MSIKDLVQPEHIKTDGHFWDTFGHSETEVSACWLVMFLQARNAAGDGKSWEPFSRAHLERFYQFMLKKPQETFLFNRLWNQYHRRDARGEHIEVKGDTITIKDSFVSRVASNAKLVTTQPQEVLEKRRVAYQETKR